jgi:hypothetical protein
MNIRIYRTQTERSAWGQDICGTDSPLVLTPRSPQKIASPDSARPDFFLILRAKVLNFNNYA